MTTWTRMTDADTAAALLPAWVRRPDDRNPWVLVSGRDLSELFELLTDGLDRHPH